MRKNHLATLTLFFSIAGISLAGPIELVTLNTSSVNGQTGSIDFQFNPGPSAQSATVTIVNFAGATYNSSADPQQDFGGASGGPVPSTLTIINSDADNEDFEGVTFGTSISFDVVFSGLAITAPSGTGESTFFFSTFEADGVTPVLTGNPNGYDAEITVTPEGNLSTDAISASIQAVPEPATFGLLGGGLIALGTFKRRFR
jgi:PEP-CTERM motif